MGCGNTISSTSDPKAAGQRPAAELEAQPPGVVDVPLERKTRSQDQQRKGTRGHYQTGWIWRSGPEQQTEITGRAVNVLPDAYQVRFAIDVTFNTFVSLKILCECLKGEPYPSLRPAVLRRGWIRIVRSLCPAVTPALAPIPTPDPLEALGN